MNSFPGTEIVFRVFTTQGGGSCFYYKELNLFVTSLHIVKGEKEVVIEDTNQNRYLASVLLVAPATGIALLRTAHSFLHLPDVVLAKKKWVKEQQVFITGFPFDENINCTDSFLEAAKTVDGNKYLLMRDSLDSWMSGGIVSDEKAQVAGMITLPDTEEDETNWVMPAQVLSAFFAKVDAGVLQNYSMECTDCTAIISLQKNRVCPHCGAEPNMDLINPESPAEFSRYCERLLKKAGISPVLCRAGYHVWKYKQGNTITRLFESDEEFLYISSCIRKIKKNNEDLYRYLLDKSMSPFHTGIEDKELYISYRVHPSDRTPSGSETVVSTFKEFLIKTHEVENYINKNFSSFLEG